MSLTNTVAIPSGSASQNIILDPDIRDWVVLPLLIIMIAAGVLRSYLGQMLKGSKNSSINPIEYQAKSCLSRTSRLKSGASNFITSGKWESRVKYFSEKQDKSNSSASAGYLYKRATKAEEQAAKQKSSGDANDILNNPMSMLEGMKGNMAFMVQNMVMMQGISHFFKGFVLLKVPFPLTNGFKMMFQRGLDLSTLETSYVSSVSWYFLVMFGLRAFFRLILGEPKPEIIRSNVIQHSFGNSNAPPLPPGQKFNAPKILTAEAENLELARSRCAIDDAEKRLLGSKFPKKINSTKNRGDDIIFGINKKNSAKKKKQ